MKIVKIIIGVALGIAAISTMIDFAKEEKGAGLVGGITGFLIMGGISAYLIYSGLQSDDSSKDLNKK